VFTPENTVSSHFHIFEFSACNAYGICVSLVDDYYLTDYIMATSDGTGLIPTGVTSANTAGALLVTVDWTLGTGTATQTLSGFYVCVESNAVFSYS
jgi:hypothetical protein